MSGQDMRKIMENLNAETPKKKLNESLGGTPIANDIMELAAKIEAIQAAADAEDLVEAEEVDETEDDEAEVSDDEDESEVVEENDDHGGHGSGEMQASADFHRNEMDTGDSSGDITRKVTGWMDIQLEGRGDFSAPINLILELMSYLPEEQVAQLMDKYQVFGDEDAEGWD